jgi:hypothetical protein
MIDSDDESTQRLKREGKLTHTISRPNLKDGGSWLSGGCLSECLQWLQSEHEGFQCTAYVIPCPFKLEKVCRMFEKRVAGGRFEGVGTLANIFGVHWLMPARYWPGNCQCCGTLPILDPCRHRRLDS